MKKELRKLTRELDRYISNGYLVKDFCLPERASNIVANWIKKHELTTYCPLEGKEFDCYLVPASEVEKLKGITR